jgi:hypothetical protein
MPRSIIEKGDIASQYFAVSRSLFHDNSYIEDYVRYCIQQWTTMKGMLESLIQITACVIYRTSQPKGCLDNHL